MTPTTTTVTDPIRDRMRESLVKAAGWNMPSLNTQQFSEPQFAGLPRDQSGPHLSISGVTSTVLYDTEMNPWQKTVALSVLDRAANGEPRGLFTTGDLVQAAVGAGLGYAAGSLFGKVLGAVAGLPAPTQRSLARVGAVGGLLKATGVWR